MTTVTTVKNTEIFKPISLLAIIAALVLWVAVGQVIAVEQPLDDNPLSIADLHVCSESHIEYGSTGIARRLLEIKKQKETAARDGRTIAPVTVSVGIPVLMGNFVDEFHIFDSSAYQELLFGSNPTGSMTDYYNEVSYGQLNVTGQVFGPFTAPESRAYYNDGAGYPANFIGYAEALLDSADQHIDFGVYDNDGPDGIPNSGDDDGYVDVVHFIFPDTGDGNSRFKGTFSFFRTAVTGVYNTNDSRSGGGQIQIDAWYRTAGEQKPSSLDEINPIGAPVHEFGHALGMPDHYDADGSTWGVGTWCLMGYGTTGACFCNAGQSRPIHMCGWCKTILGFVIPVDVVGTETVSIPPVESNPVIYRLWDDPYQGERYFLLENRTKTGFDSDIPGEGVLIWHCNGDAAFENDDETFRVIDLEEADGLDEIDSKTSWMDDGDLYPGSSNNLSFNDATYPSANDVLGNPTGVSAEGFAYTSGPGSDVTVTLTQREIMGFTLSYHPFVKMYGFGSSSPAIRYGAVRFTTPQEGYLSSVQAGVKKNSSYDYTVRIFDDMDGTSPVGLHNGSTTSGTFPSVSSKRFYDIPLIESLPLIPDQTFLIDVAFGPVVYAIPFQRRYPYTNQSYKSNDGVSYNLWTDKDILIRAQIKYSCCVLRADVDDNGSRDISDLTYYVDYLFGGGPTPPCPAQGDVDGSGAMDITDLTYFVDYLFGGGVEPPGC